MLKAANKAAPSWSPALDALIAEHSRDTTRAATSEIPPPVTAAKAVPPKAHTTTLTHARKAASKAAPPVSPQPVAVSMVPSPVTAATAAPPPSDPGTAITPNLETTPPVSDTL